MAKVILSPIGNSLPKSKHSKNKSKHSELESKLRKKQEQTREGWGQKYVDRVHEKGKLTTWERLKKLIDSEEDFFPINTFANDGIEFDQGGLKKTSPSAGVITGFGRVCARRVMIIANDNTVASGSWWPKTPEKIIRAQEIALKLKIPVIYLVDCSGLFLPEQRNSFPGKYGAGKIFKMNALLSSAGVPQITGVMGDCIAGGGYMPIISDKVIMTENAYMVIAGTAVIRGAKSQNLTSLDIGGANVHVHESNCADMRAPDDSSCIELIRHEVRKCAASASAYYQDSEPAEPNFSPLELTEVVPAGQGQLYAIREVIARLVDSSLFWEIFPQFGQEVVTGVARIGGLYVGIVANDQEPKTNPYNSEHKRPGGILYREGVSKISTFVRACNDDGIPIVWLQDISGFDVGAQAEQQGLLGYGSNLIYANSNHETPMVSVLLRKASGAGYYAMAGMPYDPVLQLSTPVTRLSVMEGKTLAIGAYHSKLDANFKIKISDKKEKSQIENGMKAIEERIERDMDPYISASNLDTDEIVALQGIRNYLVCVIDASYQSQGTRRIKNPRIWSLHDLKLLEEQLSENPVGGTGSSEIQSTFSKQKKITKNAITAPMGGIIYFRPSPEEANFISGQIITPGQTVALIEVMKCFYPIVYEGKAEVKLKAFLVEEGAVVTAGEGIINLDA